MHHQHPKYLVPKNLFYSSQQHANYPTGQSNNTRFGAWGQHLRKRAFSRITCSASSTTSAAPTPTPQPPAGVEYDFACPICLTSRLTVTRFANSSTSAHLCCTRCQRTFADAGTYVDLTLTSGATPRVYGQELSQTSVQLFRYVHVGWSTRFYVHGVRQHTGLFHTVYIPPHCPRSPHHALPILYTHTLYVFSCHHILTPPQQSTGVICIRARVEAGVCFCRVSRA